MVWYPNLAGDGTGTLEAIAYDVLGNQLADSGVQNFTSRLIGSNTTWVTLPPASGSGNAAVEVPLGTYGGKIYVDGNTDNNNANDRCIGVPPGCGTASGLSGHSTLCSINTTCWTNGNHEVYFSTNAANSTWGDPYVQGWTFTSANVSGNSITLNTPYQHGIVNGQPVILTTTGTLPTCSGCRASPLQTGNAFFWNDSPALAVAVSSNVATVTCKSACGVVTGDAVDLEGVATAGAIPGGPVPVSGANGLFTVASSSGSSATSFTVNMPGVGNGTYNQYGMRLYTHPYYGIFVDTNTVQLSETPAGSAVTITGGGTGTHTVTATIHNPWWLSSSGYSLNGNPSTTFAYKLVNFQNGAAKMEMRSYDEVYLCLPAYATASCPTSVSIAPRGINTDLSTFSITATDPTYAYSDDGGYSNVATVSSSGVVTESHAGWAKVVTSCTQGTCNGMNPITTYIRVYPGAPNFPTFTHDGHIATAYTPGQSFIPTSMWNLGIVSVDGRRDADYNWLGPEMQASGLNTTSEGIHSVFSLMQTLSCAAANAIQSGLDATAHSFANNWGTFFEYYFGDVTWPPWNFGAVLNGFNFDRLTCLKNEIASIKSDGRAYRLFGYDELNAYEGGNTPLHPGIVGTSSYFSQIVVSGCPGACVGTVSFVGSLDTSGIRIQNATNTFLNGIFVPGNVTYTSFTINLTGATNGTYNSSTDPNMELVQWYANNNNCTGGCTHQGPLLSYAGTGNPGTIQHWDGSLTSIVAASGTCIVNWTGHNMAGNGAPGSNVIYIINATTAGLNGLYYITKTGANTFTIPCSAANGTYNSSTDGSLGIEDDPFLTNATFTTLYNTFHAGGNIAVTWPAIGITYQSGLTQAIQEWEGTPNISGQPNIADAAWNYNPNPCGPGPYGDDCFLVNSAYQGAPAGLNFRAWQTEPRALDLSAGQQCAKFHAGFACDFGQGDLPVLLQLRPENYVAQVGIGLAWGESGFRTYKFDRSPVDNALQSLGSVYNAGTNAMRHYEFGASEWKGMALINNAMKRWEKYVLEPRISFESYGPFYGTARLSSYGGFKMLGLLSQSPYTQMVDLTSINQAGGFERRECVDGYRLAVTELAGNPTSDTYTFAPGELCGYVAQPSGITSDIDHIVFAPPASLPFGASKYIIRVGYYPGAMQDAAATDCTSGCTIPVNHYNADVWYQIIYTDSAGAVLSIGDPQKIPKTS